MTNSGGRKTILLSHHPLFTRHSPINGAVSNPRLFAQVAPLLTQVTLWLWGHEHCQSIFQPFSGLQRGRCLGASAIPTLPSENPYDLAAGFNQASAPALVCDPAARLKIDPATGWFDLGFALLTLDGAAGEIVYYSYDQTNGPQVLFKESLT